MISIERWLLVLYSYQIDELISSAYHEDSQVSFTTSPSVIQPPITQAMRLQCSLTDNPVVQPTPTSSGGLVGRSAPSRRSFGWQDPRFTSASVTRRTSPERVSHVTGISVTKDDVIIATVNQYFPAAVENVGHLGDVHVMGDVSTSAGGLG